MANFHTTTLKTWIGGFRNRPEEWTEPKNWYPHGVPSWTDKVILGGYSKHRCHIATGVDDISALSVLTGATLVIGEDARLTVDGLMADPLGMLGDSGLSNSGIVHNKGELSIRNVALQGIHNRGLLVNEGRIYADGSVSSDDSDWGRYADRGERVFLLPG
ncbi:MAG: hypothetical protein AB8F78_10635 [Saprospiraceae bacterium]